MKAGFHVRDTATRGSTGCQPWTVANSTCEQRNSSLASIHNELEAHFVAWCPVVGRVLDRSLLQRRQIRLD